MYCTESPRHGRLGCMIKPTQTPLLLALLLVAQVAVLPGKEEQYALFLPRLVFRTLKEHSLAHVMPSLAAKNKTKNQ